MYIPYGWVVKPLLKKTKEYMEKDLIEMKDKFLDMDKWVVIAKCSDGDIVIGKDGEIAFDIDIAGEIAKEHQNMGAEIAVMQYAQYKGIYKKN